MTFFCLLWVPLFYLLRRSLSGADSSGGVWALLLGSITAIIQFLLGYILSPGGFGFSRWLFGFVEIVSVPVLIPFVAYLFILLFRGFSSNADFGDFSLLWLIPVGALRALSWSSMNDPILLVMAPLLWTALAVGISFFISRMASGFNPIFAIIAILCIIILPISAASTYWAFFSQQTLLGFLLLIVTHIPFVLSFAIK
ncbi:hypothetical protein R84B8_01161 [Treponema sp. R8-4-B8]